MDSRHFDQLNKAVHTLSRAGDDCDDDAGELLQLRSGDPGRQLREGLRRIGR